MSVNLPIIERIALNIVDVLRGISVQAGYLNDVKVERYNKKRGNRYEDRLVVVLQADPERAVDQESVGFIHWSHPFRIACFVQESDSSDTPIDYRINTLRSDVERALMQDHTRGGWAIDTIIDDPEYMDVQGGGIQGVIVNITVEYRTSFTDPTSQTGS